MPLGRTEAKHLPQIYQGANISLFELLAKQVEYKYWRVGTSQGLDQQEDILYVHDIVRIGIRPVKIVITRDGRAWADNTHNALACLVQHGENILIESIPHYYVDFRSACPLIIQKPDMIPDEAVSLVLGNATRLQRMVDNGWRPLGVSFTLGELFELGKYSRVPRLLP